MVRCPTVKCVTTDLEDLGALMRELADLVKRFEELAPGRRFTPDGHMVGSIGELIGSVEHGLTLASASNMGWDATRLWPDGTISKVEIKATQRKSVAMRHNEPQCDEVLVIHLNFHAGTWETIYFGQAKPVWSLLSETMPPNGQRSVSLSKLAALRSSSGVGE